MDNIKKDSLKTNYNDVSICSFTIFEYLNDSFLL